MYLALRQPWAGHGTPAMSDAGVVAVASGDAGVKKPGKKRVHRRPTGGAGGGGGNIVAGGEEGWGGGDTIEEAPPQLIPLTPSDRALEWRGDDTSPPKQTIDMNSGKESRPLDDNEIRSVIESQSGGVQTCVVEGATNTNLSGTITVRMIVDGSGRVTRSKLQAPRYMHEHGLLT
jgi:hypothetical protein